MTDSANDPTPEAPADNQIEYAFVVVKTAAGFSVSPTADSPRPPSMDDLYCAGQILCRDVQISMTADATMARQMKMARAAAVHAEQARVAQMLNSRRPRPPKPLGKVRK